MANSLKQKKIRRAPDRNKGLKRRALEFINFGVGCNCLVSVSESGLLEKLLNNERINESDLEKYPNPNCIKTALVTLEKCKVVGVNSGAYHITPFGRTLADYIGLITIFFDGYGKLVASQSEIVFDKKDELEKIVNWPIVSKSSIHISEKTVVPIIIKEFLLLNMFGTICDLGCGHGVMLSKLCQQTGNDGLGFESCEKTVSEAQNNLPQNVAVELSDITNLKGIWEDVVFLMQAFVFHDFNLENKCIEIMNSYLQNFPNLRYFFYVDIVSPSKAKKGIFPGFDYVHGLLGRSTRTYEDTLSMFDSSKFAMIKEVAIPDLPNTFLWILTPKRG